MQHVDRCKDKNYVILTIDAEKALNNIQNPCLIKALKKLGIEECSST
jgi:hypothetical protein